MELPQAFEQKMRALLKEEFADFRESLEHPRSYGLRVNTLKLSPEDFEHISPFALRPVPWCAEGFYYEASDRPGKHPYHEAGLYYLQEPSAMAVVPLLDPQPGETVLDLCAAPGGKSTQIAAHMQNSGLLLSNEIHPGRAKILSQNIERMGIRNTIVANETPATLAQRFPATFDRILVDAPCSGEGMFRKEPEAIAQWSEENVARCAQRQDEILQWAAIMLKPGGRIVYSTCTFAPEEDEGSIARFLAAHPDFFLERPLEAHAPGRPEWAEGNMELAKTYRLFPHRLEGEGHFAAVLHKQEGSLPRQSTVRFPKLPKDILKHYLAFAEQIMTAVPQDNLFLFGEQLYQLPAGAPKLDGLKVLRPGWHLGTALKNRFEPAHALAMGMTAQDAAQVCALDASQALSYLSGQTLLAPGLRGWALVCLDGFALGWGKVSDGVLKNHYPKGLRILA